VHPAILIAMLISRKTFILKRILLGLVPSYRVSKRRRKE
jgi:hypothetical protein